MGIKLKVDLSGLRKRKREILAEQERLMKQLLDEVGRRTVEYLQGYTGEDPPTFSWTDEDAKQVRERVEAQPAIKRMDAAKRRIVVAAAMEKEKARRRRKARRAKGRALHPGGWADVTNTLRDSYSYSVERVAGRGWRLSIKNDAKHAATMELRDGYFVVSGVAERGGPLQRTLREVVKELVPQWEVK